MDVLLVNMPFSPVELPAIGSTLLADCLKREGFTARVLYPNIRFARAIGVEAYDDLCLSWFGHTVLMGDWLFSRLVDPAGSIEDYVRAVRQRLAADPWFGKASMGTDRICERLPGLIDAARALVDEVVRAVEQTQPRMVGFSSNFQQHLASLAAARAVKARVPHVVTVLGGTNCNGVMGTETFARFSFLDAVVHGPGEAAIVALAKGVVRGTGVESLSPMPGVYLRRGGGSMSAVAGRAAELPLDSLPFPDYSDFIDEAGAGGVKAVFVEGSRGCWWGEKHHCVFCSENAETLRYRRKSSDRMLAEIRWLASRHPGRRVHFTDEILDPRVIAPVMSQLADQSDAPKMFLSAKANVKKRELMALADAGVDVIQFGIESLDDDVLAPMRKGVTAIQNVQSLKWCRELGIQVGWAILSGFPYERPESYERMAALIPSLTHLSPPHVARVILQRFSPLVFDAAAFGVTGVEPDESYRYVYRLDAGAIGKLAYRFSADHERARGAEPWTHAVRREVDGWHAASDRAGLFYVDDGERLAICDTRPAATRFLHVLDGLARDVYRACDQAWTLSGIGEALAADGVAASQDAVEAVLSRLATERLLMTDRGRHLALAYRLTERSLPPVDVMARFLAEHKSAS